MNETLEEKVRRLEKENLDLKFNSHAQNSKVTDLEKMVQGLLSGNPQQQGKKPADAIESGFASGTPQHLIDYALGKINSL